MELDGERRIPQPRMRVWEALNDPDVLRACIPGCKTLDRTSDTTFTARVVSKIGPVSAAFSGTVELSDIVPGETYTIAGSGQGGVAGFAKGGAVVRLADDGETATVLTYKANAEVGGKLAGVGSRMLEGAARKTSDQFFDAFAAHLGGGEAPSPEAPPTGAPPMPNAQAPAPAHATAIAPGVLRIEIGEIRISHSLSPTTLIAAAGWLVAIAVLLWRGAH